MNFVREHEVLSHCGSAMESRKPPNVGCWFYRDLWFGSYYVAFRDSLAWDGDLYGWDCVFFF